MGCDIHVYMETNKTGLWEPLWKPTPHPEWWFENIVSKKLQDELTVAVLSEELSIDSSAEHFRTNVCNYYSAMSNEFITKTFSPRDIVYKWDYPCLGNDPKWCYPEIEHRDYWWFGKIANVRGTDCVWAPRGLPEDLSVETENENCRWNGGGHSHSWLMVDEMLEEEELAVTDDAYYVGTHNDHEPMQIKWLRTFVEDPENTRMVFWFDS